MIVAMVVLGGMGHLPGVILGAVLLSALPEVLRYVAKPAAGDDATAGWIAAILRQLLIALAMIVIMLMRPRGLWPSPEHGKVKPDPADRITPLSGQQNPPGVDFRRRRAGQHPAPAIPGQPLTPGDET
jgi:branched-chain amino acid transport system permease protein